LYAPWEEWKVCFVVHDIRALHFNYIPFLSFHAVFIIRFKCIFSTAFSWSSNS